MTADPIIDKHFIVVTVLLGLVYALVAILLTAWVGKEAASAASVALVAVALSALVKFERVRFRTSSALLAIPGAEPPPLHSWYLLLIVFASSGIQWLCGATFGLILRLGGSQLQQQISEAGRITTVSLVSYALLGYMAGRTSPFPRYVYAALAVFYAQAFNLCFELVDWLLSDQWWMELRLAASSQVLALEILLALGAAWLGLSGRWDHEGLVKATPSVAQPMTE